jgi:hypothetical protein
VKINYNMKTVEEIIKFLKNKKIKERRSKNRSILDSNSESYSFGRINLCNELLKWINE